MPSAIIFASFFSMSSLSAEPPLGNSNAALFLDLIKIKKWIQNPGLTLMGFPIH